MKRLTRFQTLCLGAAGALVLTCVDAAAAQSAAQKSTDSHKPATSTKRGKKHASTASTTKKSSTHTASTSTSSTKLKAANSRRKRRTARGQQKIDSERAQSIQEALIREHYLTGEATGKWNQASEDAMRRYQGDRGWQTKTVPDSRALIKLGLGPSKDHLLNPESAMTTGPDAPRAASLPPTSHSADPAVPAGKTPGSESLPTSSSQPDSSRPQ